MTKKLTPEANERVRQGDFLPGPDGQMFMTFDSIELEVGKPRGLTASLMYEGKPMLVVRANCDWVSPVGDIVRLIGINGEFDFRQEASRPIRMKRKPGTNPHSGLSASVREFLLGLRKTDGG